MSEKISLDSSVIHILFFAYICLQISRLVGLFGIEEPKQKVEFQNRDVPLCLCYSIFRQPDSIPVPPYP